MFGFTLKMYDCFPRHWEAVVSKVNHSTIHEAHIIYLCLNMKALDNNYQAHTIEFKTILRSKLDTDQRMFSNVTTYYSNCQ